MSKKKLIAVVTLLVLIIGLGVAGFFEYKHVKKVKAEKLALQQQQQQQQVMTNGKRPSDYSVGKDYNSVINNKSKPVFVLFYADWCRYCIRFMPVFEKAAEKYGNDVEFSKVNVEDKKYENLVKESRIGGFPTVMIIDKKYDNKVVIPNSSLSNLDDLSVEIDRFVKIRKLLDKK